MRLAALDPEMAAALRAVGHFDALLVAHAGLADVVRGAADLAGCPARYVDPDRGLVVRARPDGVLEAGPDPDPTWPRTSVAGTAGALVLERPGPAGTRDAVVLERAAAAVGAVLDRTRRGRPGTDPASVEVALDPTATTADRLAAARRLGLRSPARVVLRAAGAPLVLPPGAALPDGVRAGVGPVVPLADLPISADRARLALRLTAEGTEADPGPRVVHADQLGALALLVEAAEGVPVADVAHLERAAAAGPWVLATLEAVAGTTSLRDAARVVHVHHSTLQDRVLHAEADLGWEVRDPAGRLRLQLALTLRRAARRPA